MNSTKIFSYISLAKKAGYVLSGDYKVEKSLREGEAKLVIVANDSGENCKKKYSNKTYYYKVDIISFATKREIGESIGDKPKAVIAITDEGIKNEIMKLVD